MEIITNTDFLKRIKDQPDGNYLFYGEEDYLKSHAIKALKDAMGIDEALEIFNFVQLDILDYNPDKLIDMLSMPPMMAEKKLVVLNGLDIKKIYRPQKSADSGNDSEGAVGEFRALLDALAHLEEFDYNNFIMVIPFGNITEEQPKKAPSGALKALSDVLTPVKFEAPTEQKLALWVARHFEHHKIKIAPADCSYLVSYCGKDMFTLSTEIEKLSLYARSQGRDTVFRDDISSICSAEMEYGTFEFSNAILDGRKNDALDILSIMKFKQIDPIMIMGELSSIFSELLKIKMLMIAGKNDQQIAADTGIKPGKVSLYANKARRMDPQRLKMIVSMTKDADLAMKYRFDSGYLHLEKLICSI